MYPIPMDKSSQQARLIVNMVVVVFLLIGMMLVLQHFHFIYLRDVPVVGDWMMDIYERVFGAPKVLILHGDDSVGNWETLRDNLAERLIFYSDDIDVRKFGAGAGQVMSKYGLVIVEDAKQLDKDKLLNLQDYVKGGGNLIWVGDAGVLGTVSYEDTLIVNQTGWLRKQVCIDANSLAVCDCKNVGKEGSNCKLLPGEAEQTTIDFTTVIGTSFVKGLTVSSPEFEVVDRGHWSVAGIRGRFNMANVTEATAVENKYTTALVANLNVGDKAYPGVIVNDQPGSWGMSVYFAYPPEETMEVILPIVERLRY